ncbi:hypothetical protein FPV67DRAFT_1150413 [Lyophyllum atratum]|nr:hypothetical protein FPV67DRAFT_1150413 [Lyophyllum atratum]
MATSSRMHMSCPFFAAILKPFTTMQEPRLDTNPCKSRPSSPSPTYPRNPQRLLTNAGRTPPHTVHRTFCITGRRYFHPLTQVAVIVLSFVVILSFPFSNPQFLVSRRSSFSASSYLASWARPAIPLIALLIVTSFPPPTPIPPLTHDRLTRRASSALSNLIHAAAMP